MGQPNSITKFGIPDFAVAGDGKFYSDPALWGFSGLVSGVSDNESIPPISAAGGGSDPVWSAVPTITFTQGTPAQADVASLVTNEAAIWKDASALPSGVIFNESAKRYEYDGIGPIAASNNNVLYADSDSSAFTSFQLTAAVTGTHPFAIGLAFRKGDLPAGAVATTPDAAMQCAIISTWDDGSAKLCSLAGQVTLVASVAKVITLKRGANAVGAALTETDLIAAAPTASASHAAYGSVSLASLIGTSALLGIEQSSPQYAHFTYAAQFPSAPNLWCVFYVQLWTGGRARVRVRVINGSDVYVGTDRTGTFSISILGTLVFNGALTIKVGESFDQVKMSGTDPQIVPTHNPTYFRATKQVPNYGYTNPSAAVLSALNGSYSPMALVDMPDYMPGAGFNPYIGLFEHWSALYATTGDARAYASVIANARAMQAYAISLRNSTTKKSVRPSQFPTAGNNDTRIVATHTWEGAHHPNGACMAYLVTAEPFYREVMEANAWANFYCGNNSTHGSGTSRRWAHETRNVAWAFRTHLCIASLFPDADPSGWKADAQALVIANIDYLNTTHAVPNNPSTGLGAWQGDLDSAAAGNQDSLFEYLFLASALGFGWDAEIKLDSANKTKYQAVRNYFYQVPVGCLGRGQAFGEWNYRQGAGPYRTTIGPTPSTFYATWGQIQQATYNDGLDGSDGKSLVEQYIDNFDGSFAEGNWPHVLTAISFAKDHGFTGAATCYTRLTTATNWAANVPEFNNRPQYGIVSRT